jgi:hypothetical protein
VLRGRGFSMRARFFVRKHRVQTKSKKRQPTGALSGDRVPAMSEEGATSYCHECKRPLMEIDNRGRLLKGCTSCNIWWSPSGDKVRLSEEDLRSLYRIRGK